jgi:hypothetical protein
MFSFTLITTRQINSRIKINKFGVEREKVNTQMQRKTIYTRFLFTDRIYSSFRRSNGYTICIPFEVILIEELDEKVNRSPMIFDHHLWYIRSSQPKKKSKKSKKSFNQ